MICQLNPDGEDYVIHSPVYVLFVWLGIINIVIAIMLFIFETSKVKSEL